jgi:diguanylate cyclase (GGDEF)-like protein
MQLPASPEQIEDRRRAYLLYFSSSIGGAFILAMALLSLFQQRWVIAGALIASAVGLALIAWVCFRYNETRITSVVVSVVLMSLALFLVVTGAVEGTGVFYSYTLAFLMVMFTGPRLSLLFIAIYLTALLLLLNFDAAWVYQYTEAQYSRILISKVAMFSLANAGEWIRVASHERVSDAATSSLQMALTDSLTGAMNRNGASALMKDWDENQYPAVIAVIDLDHFKQVNDEFGHDSGDYVLEYYARYIRSQLKGKDIFARWGGEEFVAVLPATNILQAVKLVDAIREHFTHHTFRLHGHGFTVTMSAGITQLMSADQFEESLKQADVHLYHAKNAGRNRTYSDLN